MRYRITLSLLALALAAVPVFAQDEDTTENNQEQAESGNEKELKLEDLFPKKSIFGSTPRGMAFSHDGRWGSWLYRPHIERRHGSDIYVIDTESGEVTRLTSAMVMAEFQESARKVKEDREKKAKAKSSAGEEGGEEATADTDADNGDATDGDDAVTGVWEGSLKAAGVADDMRFKLTLKLDGESVSGTMSVMDRDVVLSDGSFDAATGTVTGRLVDEEEGSGAALEVTLKGGKLTGTISIDAIGMSFDLEGERTSTAIDGATLPFDDDDEDEEDDGEGEEIIDGNWVGEKDADDDKAPRYSGISSVVWSSVGDEFLFISESDLYRYEMESGDITRLTRTQERESGVQYLPDGSGYTYSGSGGLRCVRFGSHLIEQLEPKIPSGENMWGYELSPDGKRMVFMTTKSTGTSSTQTINIMTFRSRFAQVRQVPRQVSDDPRAKQQYSIYLYEFGDPWTEDTQLKKVFTHDVTGPRDVLQTPEWAPDSSKVAWAVFTQETGLAEIFEAGFEEPKPDDEETDDGSDESAGADEDESENETDDGEDEADDDESADPDAEPKEEAYTSRLVYKLFHNGGPTTPRMIHPYYLADSHRLAFVTEISGFRHIHILDPTYESLQQVTHGRYEVYPFGVSDDHKYLFATATKEHPTREDVYRIELETGEMKRMSTVDGVYSGAAISNDGTKALATHSTFGDLRELEYIDATAGEQRELTDTHPEKAWELTEPEPEFFTYTNRHGHEIHANIFRPDDWTAEDKRPLLIYVYGGPLGTRKTVVDGSFSSASYFFAYYMAKKHGYVTVNIDPRGVSGFGAVFEKANFERVGQPQVEDLVDGVKYLIANEGVDPERVSIHGWSFGGFQTQMCLYTEPDVFQVGIAGAGPTEWENYNQWYSTGTIGDTDEGKADLKEYSLLPLAKNLEGHLLLIHGMEDSNVLYQDTVKLYRELLKAGKETNVELFLDPTGGHGLGGDVKTINRYHKYEDFLLRYLGTGEVQTEGDDEGE